LLYSQYRKTRYLVSVILSVAKPLGGLLVVEKGPLCHGFAVSG